MTGAKKNTTNNADKNFWQEFMRITTGLDEEGGNPNGWHWFWGIYFLHLYLPDFPSFEVSKLQKKFPDIKMLQRIDDAEYFQEPPDSRIEELQDFLHQNGLFPLSTDMINMFEKVKIKEIIDFSNVQFDDLQIFANFMFPIMTSFAGAKFSNDANFANTIFCEKANFNNTTFSEPPHFNNAIFSKDVIFDMAKFSRQAFFPSTLFSSNVYFQGATFYKTALFEEVTFSRDVYFIGAKFFGPAEFILATFSGKTIFANAEFREVPDFDQVKITGHTNFNQTKFKIYAPRFHGAILYPDIIWDFATWPEDANNKISWAKIKKVIFDMPELKKLIYVWLGVKKAKNRPAIRYNQNAYETLACHMENSDKYYDQHFFFRKEMRCRRSLAKPLAKCFYWFYESLADYGYGIERALLGWFLHIFVGMILIAAATKNNLCSLPVSFANAHSFLFFNKGPVSGCYELFEGNLLFNIIWGFQTIFGVIFLFLVLLTLRIRFRLK